MAIIKSCCCFRSLRKGCYACALYTLVYYSVNILTMGHFIEVEQRYLSGHMIHPSSQPFLHPGNVTTMSISLNLTLMASSVLGFISCVLLFLGVFKDLKYMLLPWMFTMSTETLLEILNMVYLFYLQTVNFNPITAFLFTLDFFIILLNLYALICVISQFQEYLVGRGTAAFGLTDMLAMVQYTSAAQPTNTTSSAFSARRRSAGRPTPSRCDPEDGSEAPPKVITSVLSKPNRPPSAKKHVQFPDDSCIEEFSEEPTYVEPEDKGQDSRLSSLWVELESEKKEPER